MKASVIVFPGSNCDRDVKISLEKFGIKTSMVWHADAKLPKTDLVVLPGGFSYGDYLRCGSIASKSRIMKEVTAHSKKGGLVMGICNGFQVLVESQLLPGVLIRNINLKFICKNITVKVTNNGNINEQSNPNGSIKNIAGIINKKGNVFGLMPHPERASDELLGGMDGSIIFKSLK